MSKLGIKCKLYRNIGTYGAPNWSEIDLVEGLTVNPQWDMADANTRGSRVKEAEKTLMGAEATGRIRVSNTDANYIALWEAAFSDTKLDLLILNGPSNENGARGMRGFYHVTTAPEDQGIAVVLYMDFTLVPARGPNNEIIKKAVVSGGVPVLSDVAA